MRVFQSKDNDLVEIYKDPFNLEKTIQDLIEKNLNSIFLGLEFIETEFQIYDLRPDTIAFDSEKNSFVIIEYKNIQNRSLVDQGISYYQLLQDRKENFVLLYNKKKNKVLDINDINWDETRVIFISPIYTKYQERANNFQGLPIDLYEISKYENEIILLNKIENQKDNKKQIKKSSKLKKLYEYSEDEYLDGKYFRSRKPNSTAKDLFHKFKTKILEYFPELEIKQRKKYAGFYSKRDGSTICTIEITTKLLKLCYATTEKSIIPQTSFVRHMINIDGKKIGHWGIGDFMSKIKNDSDMDQAISLIEKIYDLKIK